MTELMSPKQFKAFLKEVKPRRKPVQRESQLQQSCVLWFRYTYPVLQELLLSIPNSGIRSAKNASRMKAEGMVTGAPDLMLAVARNNYYGMFIEMKSDRGRLTKEQEAMLVRLKYQGYRIEVCNSLEMFQSIINTYLS